MGLADFGTVKQVKTLVFLRVIKIKFSVVILAITASILLHLQRTIAA